MDLRTFLFVNKMTQKKLADILGYNKVTINNVVKGKKPGKGLARAIEAFTNGKVTFPKDRIKNDEVNILEQQIEEMTKALD